MKRLSIHVLWRIVIISMVLGGCGFGSRYPEAVLRGVKDRAVRTLRTERLDRSIAGLNGQHVELHVVEVTLDDLTRERRAFLTFRDGRHEYLGRLERLMPDMPLEFVILELAGHQIMAIWVDGAAVKRPTFVTVGRPEQLPDDDSMRVLSTGEVSNQVALIFIPRVAAPLWGALATARVTASDVTGYAWETKLQPPLDLTSHIVKVKLP